MTRLLSSALWCLLAASMLSSACQRKSASAPSDFKDSLAFGDDTSEKTHQLSACLSESVSGLLDQRARRLLPRNPATWDGGSLSFVMKIDPEKRPAQGPALAVSG